MPIDAAVQGATALGPRLLKVRHAAKELAGSIHVQPGHVHLLASVV